MASFVTAVVAPLRYTRCYCEENIYCLLRDHLSSEQTASSTVVFISGRTTDYVPFFYQRSASEENAPVFWDYHVILVSSICTAAETSAVVFDPDSSLVEERGSSVPFNTYVAMTLYNAGCNNPMLQRLTSYRIREAPRSFRVIPAIEYLGNFSSDRSHMRRKDGQGGDEWLAEPPPYPPIVNDSGHSNTFPYYRDFKSENCDVNPIFGKIIDESAFLKTFGMHNGEELICGPPLVQSDIFQGRRLPPGVVSQGDYECEFWPLADPDTLVPLGRDLQGGQQLISYENSITRLRPNGQYIAFVCPDCEIDYFPDPSQFNEHCRNIHGKEYSNNNERDMACGKVVRKGSNG